MCFNSSKEYYQLIGPLYSAHVHRSIIPHIFIIRTADEWNAAGIKFKKDQYGLSNNIKRNKIIYRFKQIKYFDENIINAIETKKKYISNHDAVFLSTLTSIGVNEAEIIRG